MKLLSNMIFKHCDNLNWQIIVMIFAPLLWGCGNKSSNSFESSTGELSSDFPLCQTVKDSVIEIHQPMDIEGMAMTENGLMIKSFGTPYVFYLFDQDSLQLKDSIGRYGNGEGEFLMPNLVSSHSGAAVVIDNGKQLITKIIDGKTETRDFRLIDLVNFPVSVGNSFIAYENLKGDDREIKIIKANRDIITDSLTVDLDPALPKALKLDAEGSHIAAAHMFGNHLDILTIDEKGSISKVLSLKGEGNGSPKHPSFFDVACGREYVYLLSMNDVEYLDKERKGSPSIDVYDYDGSPVKKMILDFYPNWIILDEKTGRIISYSNDDENFHIIPIE